jgi:hypothetical protein
MRRRRSKPPQRPDLTRSAGLGSRNGFVFVVVEVLDDLDELRHRSEKEISTGHAVACCRGPSGPPEPPWNLGAGRTFL